MIRTFEELTNALNCYSDTHELLRHARNMLAEADLDSEVRYTLNELCIHIEGLYPLARELHRSLAHHQTIKKE